MFLKIVRGSSPGREVSAAAAVVGRSSRSRRRRQPPQHDDEDHDAEDHDDGNHQPRPVGPGCAEGHGVGGVGREVHCHEVAVDGGTAGGIAEGIARGTSEEATVKNPRTRCTASRWHGVVAAQ